MSRSHRKSPHTGMSRAPSDKPFKVAEHRSERRTARAIVKKTADTDDRRLHGTAYGDPCRGEKDGKSRFDVRDPANAKLMRK